MVKVQQYELPTSKPRSPQEEMTQRQTGSQGGRGPSRQQIWEVSDISDQ